MEIVLFFMHACFNFHVCDMKEIFTYTVGVSREVFKKFSQKLKKIHGWKPEILRKFLRKTFLIITGKKKRCVRRHVRMHSTHVRSNVRMHSTHTQT